MGSKKIPGTSYRQRQIERYLVVGHIRPGSLKHCKCRMTLIQMTDIRMQIQSIQKPPSSHSQDQLLLQTQLRAAAIEFARDAAVRRDIRGIVGVQQVQFRPADLDLPGADPQFGAGKIQGESQPLTIGLAQRFDRQLTRVIERIQGLLLPGSIDFLTKIASLIEETDAGRGDTEVTCRLELVASNVSEPARIDGQGFA